VEVVVDRRHDLITFLLVQERRRQDQRNDRDREQDDPSGGRVQRDVL